MTAGYIVYNRYWGTGCSPTDIKSAAITELPDPEFKNGVAFVYSTRKAANLAITRAMRQGYFGPRVDWQIIRLVK